VKAPLRANEFAAALPEVASSFILRSEKYIENRRLTHSLLAIPLRRNGRVARGLFEAGLRVTSERGVSDRLGNERGFEVTCPSTRLCRSPLAGFLATLVPTLATRFDQVTTDISAGSSRVWSPLASRGLCASFGLTECDDPAGADKDRASFLLSLDHQVSEDWMPSAGVRHRVGLFDGLTDSTGHAPFPALGRDFTYRP